MTASRHNSDGLQARDSALSRMTDPMACPLSNKGNAIKVLWPQSRSKAGSPGASDRSAIRCNSPAYSNCASRPPSRMSCGYDSTKRFCCESQSIHRATRYLDVPGSDWLIIRTRSTDVVCRMWLTTTWANSSELADKLRARIIWTVDLILHIIPFLINSDDQPKIDYRDSASRKPQKFRSVWISSSLSGSGSKCIT